MAKGGGYRSRFNFIYGVMDDGNIWIQPPSNHIFSVDRTTLQVIIDLNTGLSVETVSAKYGVDREETVSLVSKLQKEGAIVDAKYAGIVFEHNREDISLSGYFLLFILLIYIQIEYFRYFASTFFIEGWLNGIIVTAIAVGVVFFHELGHYCTAVKYFRFKPKIGLVFSWIFPCVYVNTHEAWRLPRNKRLLINSAGLFADFLVNVFAITCAVNFPFLERYVTPLLLIQFTRLSLIVNPLFTSDGYWVLSDLTGTVNLSEAGRRNLNRMSFNLYSVYGLLSLVFMVFSAIGLLWFLVNSFHGLIGKLPFLQGYLVK